MRPSRSSRSGFVAGSAGALASLGVIRSAASAAQYEFKCGSLLPSEHPSSVSSRLMWSKIGEESGGRIHAQFFPNSQLGNDTSQFAQLRLGAIQFVLGSPLVLQGLIPAAGISVVGFAFKDADEGLRVLDGPLGDYLRKEFESKGFYSPGKAWDSGVSVITSSVRPIREADDLKGFKIRVAPSKITVDMFKTLGANPVPVSANEVYTALQTKLVDGEDAPIGTIEARRDYEVQKYLSLTNHSWSCLWQMANLTYWKSLPPDVTAIIERNHVKYALLERRDSKLRNAAVRDLIGRQGLTINKVDPATFRVRLRPFYEACATDFGATEWGLLQSSISGKLG